MSTFVWGQRSCSPDLEGGQDASRTMRIMLVIAGSKEARYDVVAFLLPAEQTASIWNGSDFQLCPDGLPDWVSQSPMCGGSSYPNSWGRFSEPWLCKPRQGFTWPLVEVISSCCSLYLLFAHSSPLLCWLCFVTRRLSMLCICTQLVLKDLSDVKTSGNNFFKYIYIYIFLSCQVHVGSERSAPLHLSPPGFTSAMNCHKWELKEKKIFACTTSCTLWIQYSLLVMNGL